MERLFRTKRKSLRKSGAAVSPAISTVIITATIVVIVLVAMAYGQNYLTSSIAQNEFNTNQQFMLTTGLQVDNVAWMIGRAQTIQYSSTYGDIEVVPNALVYSVEFFAGAVCKNVTTVETGILLYNVPTSEYSLGNGYIQILSESTKSSFLQYGSAAPDTYVYSIQKSGMTDGKFARIVIVPTFRIITSSMGWQMFFPLLQTGSSPGLSQSVTLVCKDVISTPPLSGITQVKVVLSPTTSYPQASAGFDSSFFPFSCQVGGDGTLTASYPETPSSSSTVLLYEGDVSISVGLYA